ncbi:MAG: flagellar hook protein FlgE, partial [Paracoccaceae bacterium]
PDESGFLVSGTGQVLMAWPANRDGTMPTYPRDTMAALEPVRINPNTYTGNPTKTMRMGVNLPATATAVGATEGPRDVTVEYFGSLGTSESLKFTFAPTVPASGASSNRWTMTVTDSALNNAVIGTYGLQFDPSQAAGGTLAAVTTTSGGGYDPDTGTITLEAEGGDISLNIGKLGEPNGMTQLSGSFAPVGISKDGSGVASLTSVEVDSKGNLFALYDQGFSRRIYQLPVIDVPNPNGLVAMTNQTYEVSPASGAFYLWDAGDGPTGTVAGFSREESSTDVAAELTQLIQTQRAYSSNAKVIQTVDEMLQETTNIKR